MYNISPIQDLKDCLCNSPSHDPHVTGAGSVSSQGGHFGRKPREETAGWCDWVDFRLPRVLENQFWELSPSKRRNHCEEIWKNIRRFTRIRGMHISIGYKLYNCFCITISNLRQYIYIMWYDIFLQYKKFNVVIKAYPRTKCRSCSEPQCLIISPCHYNVCSGGKRLRIKHNFYPLSDLFNGEC